MDRPNSIRSTKSLIRKSYGKPIRFSSLRRACIAGPAGSFPAILVSSNFVRLREPRNQPARTERCEDSSASRMMEPGDRCCCRGVPAPIVAAAVSPWSEGPSAVGTRSLQCALSREVAQFLEEKYSRTSLVFVSGCGSCRSPLSWRKATSFFFVSSASDASALVEISNVGA